MSPDDVYGNEMDGPHDFDDETADALLGTGGHDVDPALDDLIGDVRVAYTSQLPAVGAELAALMGTPAPVVTPLARRFQHMRSSLAAKVAAATAAAFATFGGLAVAGALPAPIQNAVSSIGVGQPAHEAGAEGAVEIVDTTSTTTETTETTVPDTTTTSVEDNDNHGDEVSDVAHDHDGSGCEHGHAVAEVASRGKSNGQPCKTTTTTIGGTTPTTGVDDEGDGEHNDGQHGNKHGDAQGDDHGRGRGHDDDEGDDEADGTPPATHAPHEDGGGGSHDGGHHGGGGSEQSGDD